MQISRTQLNYNTQAQRAQNPNFKGEKEIKLVQEFIEGFAKRAKSEPELKNNADKIADTFEYGLDGLIVDLIRSFNSKRSKVQISKNPIKSSPVLIDKEFRCDNFHMTQLITKNRDKSFGNIAYLYHTTFNPKNSNIFTRLFKIGKNKPENNHGAIIFNYSDSDTFKKVFAIFGLNEKGIYKFNKKVDKEIKEHFLPKGEDTLTSKNIGDMLIFTTKEI